MSCLVAYGADEGQQAADYIKDQLGSADLYAPYLFSPTQHDLLSGSSLYLYCVPMA